MQRKQSRSLCCKLASSEVRKKQDILREPEKSGSFFAHVWPDTFAPGPYLKRKLELCINRFSLFYTYSMSEMILRNGLPYKNELDKKLVKYCIFCQKICQVSHTQSANLSVHFVKTYMESGKPKTDSAYGRAMRTAFLCIHTAVCAKSIILSV